MRSPFKRGTAGSSSRPKASSMLSDSEYVEKRQRELKRQLRLQQVRSQAKRAAADVRQRVKQQQISQVHNLGRAELQKFIDIKTKELHLLEAEYQRALADIGLGHEGVREQEEYEAWLKLHRSQQAVVAEIRGEHATRVAQRQKCLESKLRHSQQGLKHSIALTEQLRAAAVRAKGKSAKPPGKMEPVQIHSNATHPRRREVRFVSRDEIICYDDQTDHSVEVRSIKPNLEHNGLEAATRLQEQERLLRHTTGEQEHTQATLKRVQWPLLSSPSSNVMDSEEDSHVLPIRGSSCQASPNPDAFDARQEDIKLASFRGQGHKNNQSEVDFVAKVLNSVERLQDGKRLEVEVQLEEVSTLASSSASGGHLPDYESVHSLIATLSRTEVTKSDTGAGRHRLLRGYIEKLLKMRREEIADLDVTSAAHSSSSNVTSSSEQSSLGSLSTSVAPHSSLSDGHFVTSTPTSIMSISGSRSSSSASRNVHFHLHSDAGGSQRMADDASRKLLEQMEHKRWEIMEQTRASLRTVANQCDLQRRVIEEELLRRRQSRSEKENVLPSLSEGPLSTSSSASSTSKSQERPHAANRSGSSYTSSSNATNEFLSKLRQLPMPTLRRPSPRQLHSDRDSSDKQNTSADLAHLPHDHDKIPSDNQLSNDHLTDAAEDSAVRKLGSISLSTSTASSK